MTPKETTPTNQTTTEVAKDGGPPTASISRRDLLRAAGAAGAAALIPGSARAVRSSESFSLPLLRETGTRGAAGTRIAGPLVNLTARETEILAAMADRLIPSDELGPGAVEAGALRFIDRLLSEAGSGSLDAYRAGIAALDRYSRYSRGAPFVELSPRDQDSLLIDVQSGSATGAATGFRGSSGSFFNMVKSHTWRGTFGDPEYGGNVDFIGWDILRYPGVRMGITEEDQKRLEADELEPVRQSAYDYRMFKIGSER